MKTTSKRSSFIDLVKFAFAVMIVFFHAGNEIFPGGRVAVEGFFMISGYFMMNSVARSKDSGDIGSSTVNFLIGKYLLLARFLIPAVGIAVIGNVAFGTMTLREAAHKAPLLLFEIIPMTALGFEEFSVIGISWYLSAMMFALAVIYPLCKKYGSKFVMIAGIPATLSAYGFLHKTMGSLSVRLWLEEPVLVPLGLIRGLAGCMAGCILYLLVKRVKECHLTVIQKAGLVIFEISGWLYFYYACKKLAKTSYDYVLVFLIFALLLIGISGLTGLSRYYSSPKTKALGTISTLLVLNHYQWIAPIQEMSGGFGVSQIPLYILMTCGSSALTYMAYHLWNAILRSIRKKSVYNEPQKQKERG